MKLSVFITLMFAVTAFSGCLENEKENETVNDQNEALIRRKLYGF